jgi:hypothetical protein
MAGDDDDAFGGVAIPIPPEIARAIMEGKRRAQDKKKEKASQTHIAAQIMDLQYAYMAFKAPEAFKVGDLVTERDALGMIGSEPAILMVFALLDASNPNDRLVIETAHSTHAFINPDCMVAYRNDGATFICPHETWRLQHYAAEAEAAA